MRVLVVDDDAGLLESLAALLAADGYEVTTTGEGRRAVAMAEAGGLDAIVCDINLPDLDGFALCRRLRGVGISTPLILLTSRDGDVDEALGLDLGADDYMTKPFSPRVLLARLRALVRRASAPAAPEAQLRRGELVIDRERLTIHYAEVPIASTVTELRLLAALVDRPGRVLSRERLLAAARDDDESVVAPRLVDTYVARLRRKLEVVRAGAGGSIETVTGAGYRWRDDG